MVIGMRLAQIYSEMLRPSMFFDKLMSVNLIFLMTAAPVHSVTAASKSIPVTSTESSNQDVKVRARLIDGYIMDSDYPSEAVETKAEGTTIAQFLISASGVVTLCKTLETSGNQALDAKTCELIQTRFKFAPAVGFDGKNVVEVRTQRVTWVYPMTMVPAPYDYSWAIDVDRDGKSKNCEVTGTPPPDFDRVKACAELYPYAPPTNASGLSVEKRLIFRYSLKVEDKLTPIVRP